MANRLKAYTVTAVIPAFNEEKKIRHVLHVLTLSPNIDEVICINDGSTDQTVSVVKEFPSVKLINLKKNRGKGFAITQGILSSGSDIILFIDADLIGLHERYIKKLITPLQNGYYDVAIGYHTFYPQERLMRPLSGERAYFKSDLLPYVHTLKQKGYGMELYLNYLFIDKKIKIFPLHGVKHPLKPNKHRLDKALKLMVTAQKDYVRQIVHQKDPVDFVINSYFYPFYLKKSPKKSSFLFLKNMLKFLE